VAPFFFPSLLLLDAGLFFFFLPQAHKLRRGEVLGSPPFFPVWLSTLTFFLFSYSSATGRSGSSSFFFLVVDRVQAFFPPLLPFADTNRFTHARNGQVSFPFSFPDMCFLPAMYCLSSFFFFFFRGMNCESSFFFTPPLPCSPPSSEVRRFFFFFFSSLCREDGTQKGDRETSRAQPFFFFFFLILSIAMEGVRKSLFFFSFYSRG